MWLAASGHPSILEGHSGAWLEYVFAAIWRAWYNVRMADSTFNLTALSERLFAEGRLTPLAGKIKDALDMTSAHTDLVPGIIIG